MTLALQHWGNGPFIRALAVQPGEITEAAQDMIDAGRYAPDQHARDGYTRIRRTARKMRDFMTAPVHLALQAGDLNGSVIKLITHTAIHDHGAEGLWQPAAFLQDQTNATDALGWSLRHGCNGFALAMIQTAAMMPQLQGAALIAASDIFDGSGFDRWQSDKGLVYGDASAAMVLDPAKGFARIVYQDTVSVAALEGMHGTDQRVTHDTRWDVSRTKQAYFAKHGSAFFFSAIAKALETLHARLLRAMQSADARIDAVVTPFVGQSVSATTYDAYFHPLAPDHTTKTLGQHTGHTGTADQVIGLAHHLETAGLNPGAHVLMIGAGAGFSTSATVVRLVRPVTQPTTGVYA